MSSTSAHVPSAFPTRVTAALLASLVAFGLAAAPTAAAQGAGRVSAEVLIVLAKEEAGAVDPELADMPALRRPPFNAFRSLRVLSRPRVALAENTEADIELPNGRRLRLRLLQITPDGRYRLKVSINRPNEADYLPLLQVVAAPGDPFFVAGQAHEGGTLILGVRVSPAR